MKDHPVYNTCILYMLEKTKVTSPVERTIPIGLQKQPIDHGRPVARSQDGHVVPVHHGVLCHHLVDQVDDEGDVVGLALLVEHVPAPLVAVGRHHDHIIS